MTGQVIKIISNLYIVLDQSSGTVYKCRARGKIKIETGNIYVGDFVEYSKTNEGVVIIEKVLPRRNWLIRPYVANIDVALIVIAAEPEPDFVLVDKIIVNCVAQKIKPIICANKLDLIVDFPMDSMIEAYSKFYDVVKVSAETGEGIRQILELVKGKTVCLAGQSATGKTSILNKITGKKEQVGDLSEKSRRGKNTTRHVEIYSHNDIKIVDTCGFSQLDTLEIHADELAQYYIDFLEYSNSCKFNACTHVNEPECAVKLALEANMIDKGRYDRYIKIYNELKERRKKRYE